MNFLESLIYGLFSGLAEVLPISSQGHQALMRIMFGSSGNTGLRDFLIHIACLIALLIGSYPYLIRLYRLNLLAQRNRRRKKKENQKVTYEIRLLKNAALPLMIGIVLCAMFLRDNIGLLLIGALFALNSVVLFIQEHIAHGNKDASKLTGVDSLLLGACGAISVLPGISRTGIMLSFAVGRGADRTRALNWSLVLSIPAIAILLVLDLISMVSAGLGVSNFVDFLGCLVSAIMAFAGTYSAILFMRFLTQKNDYSLFAYYSLGAGMLSLILYLSA